MSAGKLRFEIVRTSYAQWHWRIVASNGRILASSENYRRKVGCERAIDSLAIALDARLTRVGVRSLPGKVPPIEVRYVDDRLHPVKRPDLPAPGRL